MNQSRQNTVKRHNRQERRTNKGGPAFRNVAGATFLVTVAVEEARQRGQMSRRDTSGMRVGEVNDYVDLCRREWGVTEWAEEG